MSSTFELKQTPKDTFLVNYRDSRGDVVLSSPEYSSKGEAEKAIQDVRVGSMMSQMISVGEKEGGKYFEIKNQQGQMLIRSIVVDNELDFNNLLHSVRESACIAEVTESGA